MLQVLGSAWQPGHRGHSPGEHSNVMPISQLDSAIPQKYMSTTLWPYGYASSNAYQADPEVSTHSKTSNRARLHSSRSSTAGQAGAQDMWGVGALPPPTPLPSAPVAGKLYLGFCPSSPASGTERTASQGATFVLHWAVRWAGGLVRACYAWDNACRLAARAGWAAPPREQTQPQYLRGRGTRQ